MADDRIEIELVLNDGTIKKGFATLAKGSKKVAKQIGDDFDKSFKGKVLKSIGSFKTEILALGSAFAALSVIKNVTRDLIGFEKALAEVKTIVSDVSTVNAEFTKSLIESSAQFGTTPAAQAQQFYQIVSAGITDVTKANETLIASNKLAIGGLASTEQAIDVLTSTVNAYSNVNLSATRAADILFGTVRLGKLRVDDLASSLGQVLPAASQLGVSFEETSAAIAQLTTKGLPAAEAVTQLQAVFVALLRKQGQAKKILGANAKAFTLQALQAKGLTKFLQDLNVAIGGSEEKLVKLLGRVEGAKAIISLGADNFAGLADKIDQLRNSSGAADDAFEKISNTVGFQLQRTFSLFTAIALSPFIEGAKSAAEAIKSFNDGLESVLKSIDDVINRILATAAAVGIAVTAFLTFRAVIPILRISAFAIKELSLSTIAASVATSALGKASVIASVGVRALRVSVQAAKVALGLGLLVVLEEIAIQLIISKDATGSWGVAFEILALKGEIALRQIGNILAGFQKKFQLISGILAILTRGGAPGIAKLGDAFGQGLATSPEKLAELTGMLKELESTSLSVTNSVGNNAKKAVADTMSALKATGTNAQIAAGQVLGALAQISVEFVKTIGAAFVKGGSAFDDFKKTVFNIIGDLAIQIGTTIVGFGQAIEFLRKSLTTFFGGFAIAGGLALIAIGGALKAAAGGAISPSGGASAGASGDTDAGPDFAEDINEEIKAGPATAVNLTIQGNILDRRETGIEIAEVLNEFFDNEGGVVVTA